MYDFSFQALEVVIILFDLLKSFAGGPKPKSVDQAFLIGLVVEFVRKMLPRFNGTDILYVRSMRASKVAVMNVQCRSVIVAGLVRSTFASLVKQTPIPTFIGNVSLPKLSICVCWLIILAFLQCLT